MRKYASLTVCVLVLFGLFQLPSLSGQENIQVDMGGSYSYTTAYNLSTKPIELFISPDKTKYHVRDLETFKLIFAGDIPDNAGSGIFLFDDRVMFTTSGGDSEELIYIFHIFDGSIVSKKLDPVIYVVIDSEPIYITFKNIGERTIRAVKEGQIIWEKNAKLRRNNSFETFGNNDPLWIIENDKTKLIDPRTGYDEFVLDEIFDIKAMDTNITVLSKITGNTESFIVFDNIVKKIQNDFILEEETIYKRRIIRIDSGNTVIIDINNRTYEETPLINLDVSIYSGYETSVNHYKLSLDDKRITSTPWTYEQGAFLKDNIFVYPNYYKKVFQAVDIRDGRIIWESEPQAFKVGGGGLGYVEIKDDLVICRNDLGYLTCLDFNTFKPKWKVPISKPIQYERYEYDGLVYQAYRFPNNTTNTYDLKVKVYDARFDVSELYEYNIPGVDSYDLIVPTKLGVLIVPSIYKNRDIRLFGIGLEEPILEIHQLGDFIVTNYKLYPDGVTFYMEWMSQSDPDEKTFATEIDLGSGEYRHAILE